MKRVVKSPDEPPVLAEYKRDNAHIPANLVWARYKKRPDRREPVKEPLRTDQRGLCAYCENLLIPRMSPLSISSDAMPITARNWIGAISCSAAPAASARFLRMWKMLTCAMMRKG